MTPSHGHQSRRHFLRSAAALALVGVTSMSAGSRPLRANPSTACGIGTVVPIGTDPRIELMSVVQLLADYFLVSQYDTAYKNEMRSRFARFAAHPVVDMFRRMAEERFNFSTVPDVILRYSPPPALEPRIVVPPHLVEAAGGENRLASFIAALRAFARESAFELFFRQHEPFYAALAERAGATAAPVTAALACYVGTAIENGRVILGPLLHDGGFAAFYDLPDGSTEAFALIGPTPPVDGLPSFGDAARMEELVAHEFGHLLVNPLTERHRELVYSHEAAFAPIAEAMRRNGYADWKASVDEHVIRAITSRLAAASRGEEAGAAAAADQVGRGYVYVPALIDRLKRYERDRSRYPRLEDYYPELLRAFVVK